MSQYKITTDLYMLPAKANEDKMIYAPCLGVVLQATNITMKLLSNIDNIASMQLSPEERATLDYLIKKEIVNGKNTFTINGKKETAYKLTLFPTGKCNLSCHYCYVGKCQNSAKSMDFQTALKAIQYHGKMLKENKESIFYLELHGGGEPFFEFDLVKRIIDYLENFCQKENFKHEIFASTNGVLSDDKRSWIANHFTSLLISFDVLPNIQNQHRPFRNGYPSFKHVHDTLKYFDNNSFDYQIRTTISNKNVDLLKETIDFITSNYKTKSVFLEPVNDCGNYSVKHNLNCNLEIFSKNYLEAEVYAREKGIKTYYSGANIDRLSANFCYVGTSQYAVTPDGYFTNCWEVTSFDHPNSDTFIIGKIEDNGSFSFYKDKIEYLQNLTVDKLPYCKDCFAKWHCSGDCAMRLGHQDYKGPRGNRCTTTRNLMSEKIKDSLNYS